MNGESFEGDLDRLASAFERRFPDLRPVRPLSVLGNGFRSVALETPGGIVIRAGQSADAADDYAKEWRIGHFLTDPPSRPPSIKVLASGRKLTQSESCVADRFEGCVVPAAIS